jgi:hypothetical protein
MRSAEHETPAKDDPRRLSGVQLARLGVRLLNKFDLMMQCVTCGETWSPATDSRGKLLPGYWYCPNKCNR